MTTNTSMPTGRIATIAVSLCLAIAACGSGSGSGSAGAGEASTTVARNGATTVPAAPTRYASRAFAVPFDVEVPAWLPRDPSTDAAHLVTWEPSRPAAPAVRVLLPVNLYRPGEPEPSAPPADYVAYLLSQTKGGATFTDTERTTVGGKPATLVTAKATRNIDGSLGCPEDGIAAGDCFGLQSDLLLRLAVVDLGDRVLLVWLREQADAPRASMAKDVADFESMLGTIAFRDGEPPTTTTAVAAASPIDGVWKTAFSKDELAASPLLTDRGEVNDDNWGSFTLTLDHGHFTAAQSNSRSSSKVEGTFTAVGAVLTLFLDDQEHFTMHFSVVGDTLTLARDEKLGIAPTPLVIRPWKH